MARNYTSFVATMGSEWTDLPWRDLKQLIETTCDQRSIWHTEYHWKLLKQYIWVDFDTTLLCFGGSVQVLYRPLQQHSSSRGKHSVCPSRERASPKRKLPSLIPAAQRYWTVLCCHVWRSVANHNLPPRQWQTSHPAVSGLWRRHDAGGDEPSAPCVKMAHND